MEVAQLNNTNNLYDVNNYSINNPKKVDSPSKTGIRDVIDIEKVQSHNRVQSEFANNLISNNNELLSIEVSQSKVSQQINISSEIVKIVTKAIESNSPTQALDKIQPQVEKLINNFNKFSNDNTVTSKLSQIVEERNDENSRSYFDGQLGSKPLSSSEIFEAADQQNRRLVMIQSELNQEHKQVIEQTNNDIKQEKIVVQEKIEFKVVNFGQESAQFNNNSLTNIEGSIVSAQSNPSQEQSLKLLV